MILPMFYKPILVESSHEENNKFIKELYKTYKNEIQYKDLLNQIVRVKDIPVELLSKYFARIYTIDGNFFKNMKMALLEGNEDNEGNKVNKKNFEKYKPFIKTLYDGSEKGALKVYESLELYSAQSLSQTEIDNLVKYNNKKGQNLPSFIEFSKSFISFSKDKNVAKGFLSNGDKNAILTVVKYEKDINLNTHADIEELSAYPEEREVLFFPFSVFEIESIEPISNEPQKFNLKLTYLGKYI